MSDIEARVKKIIAEQLGVEESQVTNEKAFVADLGADSLDTVELVMALEDEFDCLTAEDADSALKRMDEEWVQAVICDQRMPGRTGVVQEAG